MCGGGGSSSSGKFEPPDYVKPWAESYLSGMGELTSQPYTQFMGQKVPELNPYQNQAYTMGTQLAIQGAPDVNAARTMMAGTLNGAYQNPYHDTQTMVPGNPYMHNSYTDRLVDQTMSDMAGAYGRGTAANLDAMAAVSGNYGNSAHNEWSNANAKQFAESAGSVANQIRSQELNAQRGLAESAINRGVSAQQFDTQFNSGLWEAERGRQMQAMGMAPTMEQMDWNAVNALSGIGDKNYAYMAGLLGEGYDEFSRQQQYPFSMADIMGNTIRTAQGGYGTNTAMNTSSSNPFVGLLGGGLLAKGMGVF